MSFFCFRIPSGYHIIFSHHVSLSSFWLWQFFRISLFLITQKLKNSDPRCILLQRRCFLPTLWTIFYNPNYLSLEFKKVYVLVSAVGLNWRDNHIWKVDPTTIIFFQVTALMHGIIKRIYEWAVMVYNTMWLQNVSYIIPSDRTKQATY